MLILTLTVALGACTVAVEPPKKDEAATDAPVAVTVSATAATPPVLSAEGACRQAVERLYGQAGDSVSWDAAGSTVSWRAPVDGGRLTFQCTADGDQVSLSHESRQVSVNLSNNAVASAAQQEAR